MQTRQYALSFIIVLALGFLGACDSDPTVSNTESVVIEQVSILEANFEGLGYEGTGADIYVNFLSNGVEIFDTRDDAIGGSPEGNLPVTIEFANPPRIRVRSGRTISVEVWDKDNSIAEGSTDDIMGESEEVNLENLIRNGAPRTLTLREREETPRMSVRLHLRYN